MKSRDNLRSNLFFGLLVIVAGLITYRLFVVAYVRHYSYSQTAQAQNENISNVLARGNIYFQDPNKTVNDPSAKDNLFLAATNKKFPLVQINPSLIDSAKADDLSKQLSDILGIDQQKTLNTINSKVASAKVIARRLTDDEVGKVKNLGVRGIMVAYETDRFYPGGELGSDVLGFLGYDESGRSGQYGIEAYYNDELFGKTQTGTENLANTTQEVTGWWGKIKNVFSKDQTKKQASKTEDAKRPSDVVLTIDKNIQSFVETKLDEVLKKWSAEKGTIIVEDPNTGKILAMVDSPTFDPNDYSVSQTSLFLNSGTQEVFEPGSSFKPITMAAGLDLGKITPETTFTDSTGSYTLGGFTMHNFNNQPFGTVTMSKVLEKSINMGTIFVENLIGDDNFLNYVVNMGFGQKTGIDMPGEVSGDISNLYSGRKINFLTASFGQGISVTPVQLINAYSVIANGGKLLKPYIVDKVIKDGGQETITKPEVVSIPISAKTASKLQQMLVSVVDNGFDKARIKGYDIAGKTGTAQISDGKGGYLENQYIHDFMGFAPAYNAKFVVLIKIEKPKGITFASDSLSPTYREIANFLLNYYNIPPTR